MSRIVRVYVPMAGSHVDRLATTSALPAEDLAVYAVTDAFRKTMPSSEDQEGLEYAVLQDAATAAAARGWRVVAAADVDELAMSETDGVDDPALVAVRGEIPRKRFASLHVLDPAGDRDPDSDLELSWYDITELDEVGRLL